MAGLMRALRSAGGGADAERDDERAYIAHERTVMAMLAARHRDLDADARYELYHEAWASVLKRRAEGVEIVNLEAYLVGTADKLAQKRLHGADARRRFTFDPVDGPFTAVADEGQSPEDVVLAADEARRVRMLIEELGDPERALLKLRLDLGLAPAEIRERLGLTDRQYRRIAERAGKALLAEFTAFDTGAWARRKRSLLCACVLGVASERQRERARVLVEQDPCCRAMMSELRRLGGQTAAVLPVPGAPLAAVAGGGEHGARIAELLAAAKQHAADALAGAKQGATGAYLRAADPTPLAGMRPGAVGTLVAGCIAAGGGAYCAVEGMPDPLRPALGLEQSAVDAEAPKPPPQEAPAAPPPVEPRPAEPPPVEPPSAQPPPSADGRPAAERQSSPPSDASPPAAPPAPDNEFEPAAPAASPQPPAAPQPAAPASPRATPAPPSGGSAEFEP